MNKRKTTAFKAVSLSAAIASALFLAGCDGDNSTSTAAVVAEGTKSFTNYEIWGPDQSNSVAGAAHGSTGSLVWIWDSADMETQLTGGAAAVAKPCNEGKTAAPCKLQDIFPDSLVEDAGTGGTIQQLTGTQTAANRDKTTGPTGQTLGSQDVKIGRIHGMLPDPQHKYMNVNGFAGNAGYVGIMDARTKEAVALWRVARTDQGRSVHMSFWNEDGTALLIANLHGRLLERIDITRDATGNITAANFNRAASLSTQGLSIVDDSTAFTGTNGNGNAMIGTISGSYDAGALGALTPNGNNKTDGTGTGTVVGRPSGIIICPIVADNGAVYVTLAGGGAIVADSTKTPMTVIGEYGNNDALGGLNGVGCGGVEVKDTTKPTQPSTVWLNSGASAAGAGASQSIFTMYTVDNSAFDTHVANGTVAALNTPASTLIFKDAGNTAHGGNVSAIATNTSGQITAAQGGTATRRDGHGMARTLQGTHIHNVDRVQNTVEVFSASGLGGSNTHIGTYNLTAADGGATGVGACAAASVTDGGALPTNDPAPDLMDTTPDGKYLLVALRGPAPVTVTHAAQGSCPGVGIIQLTNNGASGNLAGVLKTTNTIAVSAKADIGTTGGVTYPGAELSDIHGAAARQKVADGSGGYH